VCIASTRCQSWKLRISNAAGIAGAERVCEHVAHGPAVFDDVVAERQAVVVVDVVDLGRIPGRSPREVVDLVPPRREMLGKMSRRRSKPAYLGMRSGATPSRRMLS